MDAHKLLLKDPNKLTDDEVALKLWYKYDNQASSAIIFTLTEEIELKVHSSPLINKSSRAIWNHLHNEYGTTGFKADYHTILMKLVNMHLNNHNRNIQDYSDKFQQAKATFTEVWTEDIVISERGICILYLAGLRGVPRFENLLRRENQPDTRSATLKDLMANAHAESGSPPPGSTPASGSRLIVPTGPTAHKGDLAGSARPPGSTNQMPNKRNHNIRVQAPMRPVPAEQWIERPSQNTSRASIYTSTFATVATPHRVLRRETIGDNPMAICKIPGYDSHTNARCFIQNPTKRTPNWGVKRENGIIAKPTNAKPISAKPSKALPIEVCPAPAFNAQLVDDNGMPASGPWTVELDTSFTLLPAPEYGSWLAKGDGHPGTSADGNDVKQRRQDERKAFESEKEEKKAVKEGHQDNSEQSTAGAAEFLAESLR